MGEWVNEKDQLGNGIRVPATYHVQVFDNKVTPNSQRKAQLKIDSPANYFFTFDDVLWNDYFEDKVSTLPQDLVAAGVTDLVKLVTIPQEANKIRVRLENLGDFLVKGAQPQTVDLEAVITALVKDSNAEKIDLEMEIKEKSMTGNMDIEEMWDRKIQWQTMDDGFKNATKLNKDQDFSKVQLELQRIRVFDITIKATQEIQSFLN